MVNEETTGQEEKTFNEVDLVNMMEQVLCNGSDAQHNILHAGVEIIKLLLRKNSDYGGSAFRRPVLAPNLPPRTAMLCRMSDKIARMGQLGDGEGAVKDETVDDTIRDLAGYCILYMAYQEEDET